MKKLYLTLNKKWFDLISSGVKKEEYREIKSYWSRRFYRCVNGCNKKRYDGNCQEIKNNHVVVSFPCHKCDWSKNVKYDLIEFINGYSKTSPRVTVELIGIEIGKGKPEWGAPVENIYILRLGQIQKSA